MVKIIPNAAVHTKNATFFGTVLFQIHFHGNCLNLAPLNHTKCKRTLSIPLLFGYVCLEWKQGGKQGGGRGSENIPTNLFPPKSGWKLEWRKFSFSPNVGPTPTFTWPQPNKALVSMSYNQQAHKEKFENIMNPLDWSPHSNIPTLYFNHPKFHKDIFNQEILYHLKEINVTAGILSKFSLILITI